MNVRAAASSELVVASTVVLLVLAFIYFFAFRLRGQRFFGLVGAAWLLNSFYIGTEASQVPIFPHAPIAISSAALMYAAFFFLARCSAFPIGAIETRLTIATFAIVLCSLGLTSTLTLSQDDGFWLQSGSVMLLTAWVLLRLGFLLLRQDPKNILKLLGSWEQISTQVLRLPVQGDLAALQPYYPVMSEDTTPDWFPESSYRSLVIGKAFMAFSLIGYGGLQFSYPLKYYESPLAPYLFWVALLLKLGNGVGLSLILLGDFRAFAEAFRLQALTVELGAFTASIEHDMRNPISTLEKTIYVISRRYQHDAFLLTKISELTRQLTRIKAVVDVIPQMRESREYYARRFHRWNLLDILRTASNYVSGTTEIKPRITVDSRTSVVNVLAYRERLIQAFVNILNNSLEAYRERNAPAIIAINVTTAGRLVTTVVRDEAGGIPHEIVNLVTRPLFSTKTGGRANRGLGLFTASRFIEHHQGSLAIHSDGQSFTEIIVELPLAAREARERTGDG